MKFRILFCWGLKLPSIGQINLCIWHPSIFTYSILTLLSHNKNLQWLEQEFYTTKCPKAVKIIQKFGLQQNSVSFFLSLLLLEFLYYFILYI